MINKSHFDMSGLLPSPLEVAIVLVCMVLTQMKTSEETEATVSVCSVFHLHQEPTVSH